METSVNERLNLIVEKFEKGKKAGFARTIGLTPQGVQSMLAGRQSEPSFEVLNKILKGYPQVNTDWLVQGTGPMLKSQQPEGAGLTNGTGATESASAATERENALLRQQVAHLTSMLDWVKGLVPAAVGKLWGNHDAAQGGQGSYSYGVGALSFPG